MSIMGSEAGQGDLEVETVLVPHHMPLLDQLAEIRAPDRFVGMVEAKLLSLLVGGGMLESGFPVDWGSEGREVLG